MKHAYSSYLYEYYNGNSSSEGKQLLDSFNIANKVNTQGRIHDLNPLRPKGKKIIFKKVKNETKKSYAESQDSRPRYRRVKKRSDKN